MIDENLEDLEESQESYSTVNRYLSRFNEVDKPNLEFSPRYFKNVFETVTTYRNAAEDQGFENDLTQRIDENYTELVTEFASCRPEDFIHSVLSMSEETFEVEPSQEEYTSVSMPQYPALENGVDVKTHVNYGVGLQFIPDESHSLKHLNNLMARPVSTAFENVLRPELSRRRMVEKDKPATLNMMRF